MPQLNWWKGLPIALLFICLSPTPSLPLPSAVLTPLSDTPACLALCGHLFSCGGVDPPLVQWGRGPEPACCGSARSSVCFLCLLEDTRQGHRGKSELSTRTQPQTTRAQTRHGLDDTLYNYSFVFEGKATGTALFTFSCTVKPN